MNSNNLNNKIVLIVETHKNKISNPKNKAVVTRGKDLQEEDKSKQDVGHDTHSMWEQAVKKHKEQQEKSDKKESLLDKLLGKDAKEKEKSELEKKQEELESMGEKRCF